MNTTYKRVSNRVPISGGQSVEIEPGDPWPSAYRGSQYSLVTDSDFEGTTLKWEHRGLAVYGEVPSGLHDAMERAGKEGGHGSFRITARGEVLTKVPAESYDRLDRAPTTSGWIPVYLGRISGKIDLGTISTDPPVPDEVSVWIGPPFNHGERWSVSSDGRLIWTWRDYRFESAFTHSDLVAAYSEYRPNPGRLYLTEHGHVWVNVPRGNIAAGKGAEISDAVRQWKSTADKTGDETTLRLVTRRLKATSQSDDPADGQLPVHLGHLREFDDGVVPRVVVDDETYFSVVGRYEDAWG